jgi:hypothetical protein
MGALQFEGPAFNRFQPVAVPVPCAYLTAPTSNQGQAIWNGVISPPFTGKASLERSMSDLPLSNTEKQNRFADAGAAHRQDTSLDNADDFRADAEFDSTSDQQSPLFPSHQCTGLSEEWQSIQAGFVDSPRMSVEKADALVKKTIDTLASSFAEMRSSLEQTWEKDKEVSTEELRLAFQNYRSFFQRLLSL